MEPLENILVTGGAGFIGSHLCLALLQRGYRVTVLDNLSPQIHGENTDITSPLYNSIKGKVNFIRGSVTDREALQTALKNQDTVIHLAAETGTAQSMYEIKRYADVNISGTAQILELLTTGKFPVRKIILASSRAVYGEGKYLCDSCGIVYPYTRGDNDMRMGNFECKCPVCGAVVKPAATSEHSVLRPASIYGITKQAQEQIISTICRNIGIDWVILRYQNVYGPGQSLCNPYTGVLSFFSNQIKKDKIVNIFEDGSESRDFVYIHDVVCATILGLEKDEANGHTCNVGTGIATDMLTVAKTLIEKSGIDVPVRISGDYRLGDIRHNYADTDLARTVLAFQSKWNFDKGLLRWVEWIECNPFY